LIERTSPTRFEKCGDKKSGGSDFSGVLMRKKVTEVTEVTRALSAKTKKCRLKRSGRSGRFVVFVGIFENLKVGNPGEVSEVGESLHLGKRV
jgi:hypothetical protein